MVDCTHVYVKESSFSQPDNVFLGVFSKKNFKEGDIVENAKVKATTDWGIFLDIDGIDALLHVSDLSYGRVKKPSDLVTIGQNLKVKITKIDKTTNRVSASIKALKTANLTIDDMDLYEVNEAFAPVPLAWADDLKADKLKLNVNGGAMALGHPLGATGAKLMTTLLHEMERREATYGLQAICEGGGTANATIIKRSE